MIRHTSFAHGWFYHYRHHVNKADSLCAGCFHGLNSFMDTVHTQCPDEIFATGPRSSKMRFRVDVPLLHVQGHEVSTYAAAAHEMISAGSAHTRVQKAMLEHDDKSVAVELPIWLYSDELENYSSIFHSELPLTGHIDVVRIEDGMIWVWDYKPKASKEKYAATQVLLYAYMLSMRTGIPLDSFRCGYFDEKDTYIFVPDKSALGV